MKKTKKIQFIFKVYNDFKYLDKNNKIIEFGIIKITSYPPDGVYISKDNYKGFYRVFEFKVKRIA